MPVASGAVTLPPCAWKTASAFIAIAVTLTRTPEQLQTNLQSVATDPRRRYALLLRQTRTQGPRILQRRQRQHRYPEPVLPIHADLRNACCQPATRQTR